ncbi:MAG: nuclear transport factor 2 family protein [Pseudomonadales bacterium]|nr:nuclear transport factor 2 family protein [Pseudomonadales bacterium]
MTSEGEILKLMNDYCYAIDSGDLKTFGQLLKHAEWIAEGKKPGKESQSNLILYEDGTPRTKHTLSNISIEIDEAGGTAKAHSYVTVFQQTEALPLQPIYSGDYFDEFERVNGMWQFSRREIRNSLIGNMSAHLKNPSITIPGA